MIKRTHILREYNFNSEALPIMLAAVLLNVGGRQLGDYAELDFIFVDMIGTAFCAILLGPWWAAAVAAATSTINGNFFTNYFAFGIVNVMGALTWGYLARAMDLRRVIASQKSALGQLLPRILVLGAAGSVVCGLGSSIVKFVLYPPMGRPLVYSRFEIATQHFFEQLGYHLRPEAVLIFTDLHRDVIDKSLAILVAVALASFTAPGALQANQRNAQTLAARCRTDYESIFLFVAIYSAYLALARIITPNIIFAGAVSELAWLGNSSIIVMLFSPIVLAFLVFLFGTYRNARGEDCIVELNRQRRRQARRALELRAQQDIADAPAGALNFGLANKVITRLGVEPLAIAASLWSIRNTFGSDVAVLAAMFSAFAAVIVFIIAIRRSFPRLERILAGMDALRGWLTIGSQSRTPDALGVLTKLLRQDVFVAHTQTSTIGPVTGVVGFERRQEAERPCFIGVVDSPAGVTLSVVDAVEALGRRLGVRHIILATTTSRILDPDVATVLRRLKAQSMDLSLLNWNDLAMLVAADATGNSTHIVLKSARARAFFAAHNGDDLMNRASSSAPEALAERALPALRLMIQLAPKGSRVFDLGCGYGRHALAAVQAGHEVVCVEKQQHVADAARANLEALGARDAVVICGDMTALRADAHGCADFVICTGVLQHAETSEQLSGWLKHMATLTTSPGAVIYIEMLFGMRFDGVPRPSRLSLTPEEFAATLAAHFPSHSWLIELREGPVRQVQNYGSGSRSFDTSGFSLVESTTAQYVVWRLA